MSDMMFREPNQIKWVGTRPGHNGKQKLIKIESAVSALLYTVTAATVFYLTAYYIGTSQNDTGSALLTVRNALDAEQYHLAFPTGYALMPGAGHGMTFYFPLEIAAGWDFYLTCDCACRGFIAGWEE